MFGNKKMYKKGLADAMSAYKNFGQKQEDAIAALRAEVRNGTEKLEDALSGLGDEINGIYDHLDAKEKAALYHLNTPFDIKHLDESEQQLLLAVLVQLANDEGSAVNEYQQTYIQGVKRYLDIAAPQTSLDDLSVVGDIDSGVAQKAILQTVLEFFYLQDSDELTDAQEEFLENFSVNKKQAQAIEASVSRLFNATGAKGLAEKYGNDEVIQQSKNEQLEVFHYLEKWVDVRNGLGVSCVAGYSSISIYKNYSEVSRLACMENESFSSNDQCQSQAKNKLESYHRQIEKSMAKYTKNHGENSVYADCARQLDSRINNVKDEFSKLRNSKTASILNEINKYLSKTKVLDQMKSKNEQLAEKYTLPSVSNFIGEISYDVWDPSEFETGLAKMFAKAFKRYGYDIGSAIDSMCNSGREELSAYVDDFVGQFNDAIERYIVEPIQELMPDLGDILSGEEPD